VAAKQQVIELKTEEGVLKEIQNMNKKKNEVREK